MTGLFRGGFVGCLVSFSFFLSFFVSFFPVFLFPFFSPSSVSDFLPTLCLLIANMAHSSSRRRTVPERSRSRDNYMWQNRHTLQQDRQHYPWPEDPPPSPRLRKVLAIVDLEQVRPLMNKAHDDSMAATTCAVLPRLNRVEERALFTYKSCSTHTGWKPLRCTTCCTVSANISGTHGIDIYLRHPWT